MFNTFFRKPYGVGSSLNIHMFRPDRVAHALRLALVERDYFYARCRVLAYQALHPHDPWLTERAIRFIKEFLTQEMTVVEFGSGRSTRWLARRVRRLISVEDDPIWQAQVAPRLRGLNVAYHLARKGDAASYLAPLLEIPDASADMILVDGSHRDRCVAAASHKVKPGGIIVVDNADLQIDVAPLDHFTRIETSNGVWRTDIYRRPV